MGPCVPYLGIFKKQKGIFINKINEKLNLIFQNQNHSTGRNPDDCKQKGRKDKNLSDYLDENSIRF